MRNDDRIRVRHMIDGAQSAVQFMTGRTRQDLNRDRMLLFAVIRAIEILGEAAGKVSQETRTANTTVPWAAIVSMRNRLIHGYFDIDTGIVWKTVTEEIPGLLPALRTLIDE